MITRATLHNLIDELPEDVLEMAELALRRLLAIKDDPFWKALEDSPIDDEPLDDETIAALDAAQARLGRGRAAVNTSKKS